MATNDNYSVLANNSTGVGQLLSSIDAYKYNPSGIQHAVLNHLSGVLNGEYDIVDPSNPFVFLLESSSVATAAAIIDNEASTRKLYPSVAQTVEDLYLHMSDQDYIDRFAIPSKTKFSLLIDKDELLNAMVLDGLTGIRKITIPRNSEFVVAGTTFSLQYPIDIKQMQHGGLQVVYDVTKVSPLQTLSTNLVEWEIRSTPGSTQEWLYLTFDVYQFKLNTYSGNLNTATGYSQDIKLTDDYYFARVFYKQNDTIGWVEMKTTHTDQVYDPLNPTAVLKVLDGFVRVNIPQIYTTNGLISGSVRVDIYETKGNVNMLLSNYGQTAFTAQWLSVDSKETTTFTTALNTIRNLIVYSTNIVSGGSSAMSFDDLRIRVIQNSVGDRQIPITNNQIANALTLQGYDIVKNVDVVTNRVFLATKPLPKPFDPKLITAGATSVGTLSVSFMDAITHQEVNNHDKRITITPNLIYKNDNGIITPVSNTDKLSLLSNPVDKIAQKVTNGNYLYTPFHYVLDASLNEFEVRPYFFDKPTAESITFIEHNDTTGYSVNTKSYAFTKVETGYKLTLVTTSNDTYKGIDINFRQVILSYVPDNEQDRAYLLGKYIGDDDLGEAIFEFDIDTTFDVDSNDELQLNSFYMYTKDAKVFGSKLLNTFDVIYSTNAGVTTQWMSATMDSIIPSFLALPSSVGITRENIKLRFGYSLSTLWSRSRSVVNGDNYARYTSDIPLYYEEDQYRRDAVTGSIYSVNPDGTLNFELLHAKGDPVLDDRGLPVYKHKVGDIIYDEFGQIVPQNQNSIVRQIDMMFIEGAYFFATDSAAMTYRQSIVDTIVNWLINDLDTLKDNLLELTRIYFYPKTTMGVISVMIKDGVKAIVEAGQYFTVNLYVSDVVYNNTSLRDSISKNTIETIDSVLNATQVSNSNITSALKEVYGNDVYAVSITGLGGSNAIDAMTILEDGQRLSIRKKLQAMPDGSLIVAEDVTINFIKHSLNK